MIVAARHGNKTMPMLHLLRRFHDVNSRRDPQIRSISATIRHKQFKEVRGAVSVMNQQVLSIACYTQNHLLKAFQEMGSREFTISSSSANIPAHLRMKLMKSYVSCGDLQRARQLFDKNPGPDLRLWTLLISAYTKHGKPRESLRLYHELRRKNVEPDKLVLLAVAKACAALSDLVNAKEIHQDATGFELGLDLVLGNALINMYGKCGFVQGARRVFDNLPERDVISWTSLASGYVNEGLRHEALRTIREMGLSGVKPNSVTVSSILPACSNLRALILGREIHGFSIRNRLVENVFVSSGLVDMYANCLNIKQARNVFDKMPRRDVVSWNVILTSYFQNGECDKALELFEEMKYSGTKPDLASWNAMIGGFIQNGQVDKAIQFLGLMQKQGSKPDRITIASMLPVFTHLESLRGGKEIHGYSIGHGFTEDVVVATALVLMYAKCGDLGISKKLFDEMPKRDTVAWNTMILANSMHGHGEEALLLFDKMLNMGIKPNSATFAAVLSGCSHSRLVNEASNLFASMSRDHGLEPDADHYASMVDVFSRSGHLEKAYEFIKKMPLEPTASSWGALLGACRVYKNVELGKVAANHLFEIEPDNAGNYVLLSNIFVGAGLWEEASKIRKLMRERGISKAPGCSWIQVKNKVYTFVVGDRSHVQTDEIYAFLAELGNKMKLAGYLPDTGFVLQDMNQEEKEQVLCSHSEKLAVAFGLLNSGKGSPIRVFKNLRICGDCHNAIKFMAKIVGVEITVRDNLRFHHFRDGLCSCRDFW